MVGGPSQQGRVGRDCPIRGQYLGHVICLVQSQPSILKKICRDQTQQTWPAAINLMENQCSVSRMLQKLSNFHKKIHEKNSNLMFEGVFGIMNISSIETLFNTTLMVFFLEGK